jgi:PAS domain-containing protein
MELDLTRHRAYLLQRENERLREVLKLRLNNKTGGKVLAQFNSDLAGNVRDILQALRSTKFKNVIKTRVGSFSESQKSFLIVDSSKEDLPIIFASEEFLDLSGYHASEVTSRPSPIVLQGIGAEASDFRKLKVALEEGREDSETIKCFRLDGTPFLNRIQVAPLHGIRGRAKLAVILNCEVCCNLLCVPFLTLIRVNQYAT